MPSGWFCVSSNYALTIPKGYMQWFLLILHSVLISVCCSYIIMWKSPSFHDILFTDGYRFTWDIALNSRNSHIWDDENPHALYVHGYQLRFGM